MVQYQAVEDLPNSQRPINNKRKGSSPRARPQDIDLSENARKILRNYDIPSFKSPDDPKLLRNAIERRPCREPEPPILHAGFPLVGRYEAHCRSQIRSARAISPIRRPSVLRTASAPLSTSEKYAELKRLCVGNRVADLELLLQQSAFDVRGKQAKTASADALLSATEFGFQDIVKTLLSAGISPDVYRTIKEGTSLHIAVAAGNIGMIKLLLGHHADVNFHGGPAETALKLAVLASNPDTEIISMLLDAGAQVQDADRYPSSLQACAYRDQRAILGQLCRSATGSGIDFAHPVHGTVLQTAAAYGKIECARILKDFGAKFDVSCMPYGSPLHAAVYWGQIDMCRLALRGVTETSSSTSSICDINLLHLVVSHGHAEISKILLGIGALTQNSTDDSHEKLLEAAFLSGSVETLDHLCNAGLRPETCLQNESGLSVASVISKGHSAMACTMIDIGFDRDGRPLSYYNPDSSPIRIAARNRDLEMVRYLVSVQADVQVDLTQEVAAIGSLKLLVYLAQRCWDTFKEERDAALLVAIRKEHRAAASYLALQGATISKPRTLLAELLEKNSVEGARLLLELIGQDQLSVSSQTSILCKALGNRQWEMVDMLLDVLIDVRHDQHKLDRDQLDPLSWAVNERNPAALKLLLRSRFDANACADDRSNSPLCRAVRKGNAELVKILLHYNANPNVFVHGKGNSVPLLCFAIGLCPLEDMFFGFQKGQNEITEGSAPHEIVMALIEAGADINIDNSIAEQDSESDGTRRRTSRRERYKDSAITPLYVASNRGLYEIVMTLVKKGARFTPITGQLAVNAIRRALFRDDVKSAELLIRAGVEVDDHLMEILQKAGFTVEGRTGAGSKDLRLVQCRASSDLKGGRSSDALGGKSWQLLLGPMANYVAESMPEYLERRKAAKCIKNV